LLYCGVLIGKYTFVQLLPLFKIKKRLKKLAGRGCLLGRGWLRSCRVVLVVVLGIHLAVVPVVVWAADRVASAWCCLASGRASGAGAGGCSARWLSSRGLRAGCLLPGGSGRVAAGSCRILVASGWLAVVPSGGCGFLS